MKKKIVFTGGGTAGHVNPNIAILNQLNHEDWDVYYIGSKGGIEKQLIGKIKIPYYEISSGKLRRYLDLENIKDIFRVVKGCFEARIVLKKIRPDIVFSKGGFVTVPVVISAYYLKIPVLIHESDISPGLANRISQRFASKIYTTFEQTLNYFPSDKTKRVGSPIRKEIMSGNKKKGLNFLGFDENIPILMVMGGSLGASKINNIIWNNLDELTSLYQVIHICGKDNINSSLLNKVRYKQFEYINHQLPDILAVTDMVVTRGGSNAIFEFLALRIPMLIIPLGKDQSRGDQLLNAKIFEECGYSLTLEEESLDNNTFLQSLNNLENNKQIIVERMKTLEEVNAVSTIIEDFYTIID